MLNQDVTVDFSANVAPLTSSLSQAIAQTQQMAKSTDSTIGRINSLNSAFLNMTQKLASISGANKTAVSSAAQYEQMLGSINATTAVSQKSFKGLADTTMKFARDFPIGMSKAIETTKSLTTAGVTSTKEVARLGKEIIKIQAATGEWGSGFAQDVVQLTRSFGYSNTMVKSFGDSITSLSAKVGVSASSTVGFAKAIAPVAAMAGMGETSVLGLSAAFSSMGEDGFRSAQAINKVIVDLSRSVRTGSPEVKEYAKALNMSSEALTSMFKNDPTAVIQKFVRVISSEGQNASNVLDNLGIDSVNAMKSLQSLGSSGKLDSAITMAKKSLDNGSASTGAETALGGVNDQITKLQETVQQTAVTAGKPFLGFLNSVLGVANTASHGVMSLVTAFAGFGPLLPILSAVFVVLKGIATVSVGMMAMSWIKSSQGFGAFKAGRADAGAGLATQAGRTAAGVTTPVPTGLAYRAGAVTQQASIVNTVKNLAATGQQAMVPSYMSTAREVIKNPGTALRTVASGVANYQASFYGKNDISKPTYYQSEANMARLNNKLLLSQGGGLLSMEQQRALIGTDAKGMLMAHTPGDQNQLLKSQMAGKSAVNGQIPAILQKGDIGRLTSAQYVQDANMTGFGAQLRQARLAVRDFGDNMVGTSKEIGKGVQYINTKGEGSGALGKGVFRNAAGDPTMLRGMMPMVGIMAGMAAYGKLKEFSDVANKQVRGLENVTDVYNKFAEKANMPGYQTTGQTAASNVDAVVANATQNANGTKGALDIINNQSAINAATSSQYVRASSIDKNFGPKEMAEQAMSLYSQSGMNAQAVARYILDSVNARGVEDTRKMIGYLKGYLVTSDKTSSPDIKYIKNTLDSFAGLAGNSRMGQSASNLNDLLGGYLKSRIDSLDTTNTGNKYGKGGLTGAQVNNNNVAARLLLAFGKSNTLKSKTSVDVDLNKILGFNVATNPRDRTYEVDVPKLVYGLFSGGMKGNNPANKAFDKEIAEYFVEHQKDAKTMGIDTKGSLNAVANRVSNYNSYSALDKTPGFTPEVTNRLLKWMAGQMGGANAIDTTAAEKYSRFIADSAQGGGEGTGNKYENVPTDYMVNKAANKRDKAIKKYGSITIAQAMGGIDKNESISNVLFMAEDLAATQHKTVQQFAADKKLMSNTTDEQKVAIKAYLNTNDKVTQAQFSAIVATSALALSGNNASKALNMLTAQMTSSQFAPSSSQTQALGGAYSNLVSLAQVQASGNSAKENILTGLTAGKGASVVTSGSENSLQAQQAGVAMGNQAIQSMYGQAKALANLNHALENQNADYNRQVTIANRDFARNQLWQEEDYHKSRSRQFTQFTKNMLYAAQDFAKSFYAPFQRVQIVRTLDTNSTVGNLKQQNTMLAQQMSNVRKLRQLGVTEETIRTLDLFNPANAQQTARMLADMQKDQTLVGQVNTQTHTRNKLATQNIDSEHNTAMQRQRDQFTQQIAWFDADYKIARNHAAHLHKVQMHDMASQFSIMTQRAYTDLLKFGDNATIAGNTAAEKFATAIAGMPASAGSQGKATAKAFLDEYNALMGDNGELQFQVQSAVKNNKGKTVGEIIAQDVAVTGYYENDKHKNVAGTFQYSSKSKHWQVLDVANNKWKNLNDSVIIYSEYDKKKDKMTMPISHYKAEGGYIHGPGTKTSDSVPAMLSRGEYVIKADSVDKYGVAMLDAINSARYASGGYIGGNEASAARMANYTTHVSNTSSHNYDHSTQINGPITVQANDPQAFLDQINARQKMQRLIQPVGN